MKSIGIIIGNITNSAGTERAVTNLANMLAKNTNYNPVIISLYSSSGDCYYPLDTSVKILHCGFSLSPISKRIASYLYYARTINSIIKKESLSAVLATGHQTNSLLVFVSKKVKRIACEHMNYDAAPSYSKIIRRLCYPQLDAVITLTNADEKKYSFINSEKLFVIPNSLSFESSTPSTCEAKRIIAVGRLTNQKGFDMLLDSAAIIQKEIPDWHLDIFGDGEDKDMLVQKINDLGLQNFVSINNPTPKIKEELENSSIYIMSSRYEGLPMVLIEAQECGLPAISFDCPNGPADVIIDEKTGFVVPFADIKILAEKTIELAKSDDKRKLFGKQAKEMAKRFSTERIAQLWEEMFQTVFENGV